MRFRYWSRFSRALLAAGLVLAAAPSLAEPASYRAKLEWFTKAWRAHEAKAVPYWSAIAEKRRIRFAKFRNGEPVTLNDYVLTQPPLYTGPPRPRDPDAPKDKPRAKIPLVPDLLKAAAEQFRFVPERPKNDLEFKRVYAQIAKASGITRDQAVRIYAFETGGNGKYDVQSGLTHPGPKARAISSAIGYNQLLTTNSVSLLAGHGEQFVSALRQMADMLAGERRKTVDNKIAILRRMIAHSRSVPNKWSEHEKLAKTRGGWGIHAAVLDRDIGPLLQTQKLLNSINHARRKGLNKRLTAAEVELMNLTGDGNGFDMVMMPPALREKVPTANFFQRGGYERNSIARRTGVVSALIASMEERMDRLSKNAGAKELAAAF
jgi:hypothetical protein